MLRISLSELAPVCAAGQLAAALGDGWRWAAYRTFSAGGSAKALPGNQLNEPLPQRKFNTAPRSDDEDSMPGADEQKQLYAQTDAAYGVRGPQTVRHLFSIKPSALSPLYPIFRENQALQERFMFLQETLASHELLKTQLDIPGEPLEETLRRRRISLQQLQQQLEQLLDKPLAQLCLPDSGRMMGPVGDNGYFPMFGYYELLTDILRMKDKQALEFRQVLEGDASIWSYWFNTFTPQYQGLPSIGTLESIFNKQQFTKGSGPDLHKEARAQLKQEVPGPRQKRVDIMGRARATGKRKTSVAQVYLWEGEGCIMVNKQPFDAYFRDLVLRQHLLKPLILTGALGKVNIAIQVSGGGISGQAQAGCHGIARALQNFAPDSYRTALKTAQLLRRDPRMVERKKYGRFKARKGFTYVKR